MTRTPAPDPSATEPGSGPPRCAPAEYSGHVQPAAATAYRSHASVYDRRTEVSSCRTGCEGAEQRRAASALASTRAVTSAALPACSRPVGSPRVGRSGAAAGGDARHAREGCRDTGQLHPTEAFTVQLPGQQHGDRRVQ